MRLLCGPVPDPAAVAAAVRAGADAVWLRAAADALDAPALRACVAAVPPGVGCWLAVPPTDRLDGIDQLRVDTLLLEGNPPPPLIGGLQRRYRWLRVVVAPTTATSARLCALTADGLLLATSLLDTSLGPKPPPIWSEVPHPAAFGLVVPPDPLALAAAGAQCVGLPR